MSTGEILLRIAAVTVAVSLLVIVLRVIDRAARRVTRALPMSRLKLTASNMVSKPLNTLLSLVLLSFGTGIISLLLLLDNQMRDKFNRNIKDIDFVLAAKGSELQSILANVYHVDAPTGNISMTEAQRIVRSPMVKDAIPLSLGDNYEKWRIVGTTKKYPEHYGCAVLTGKLFSAPFEVTLGYKVARETGLKPGDSFTSVHGYDNAAGEEDHHHEHPFTVVGVFAESGAVIDNLILTPLESVWMVHDHGHDHTHEAGADSSHTHEGHDHAHEAEKEVTAYLLKKSNRGAFGMLARQVENTTMQLANVAIQNNRLLNNFGIGLDTLRVVAILIMVISFLSVFISLYNSLKERRYELALMRTMGSSRIGLFQLMLGEGVLLSLTGYAMGLLFSRTALATMSHYMDESFHYSFEGMGLIGREWWLLAVTLAVGVMASLLPAWRALRIDISKTLANE